MLFQLLPGYRWLEIARAKVPQVVAGTDAVAPVLRTGRTDIEQQQAGKQRFQKKVQELRVLQGHGNLVLRYGPPEPGFHAVRLHPPGYRNITAARSSIDPAPHYQAGGVSPA
ncbi:hypothetical protein D9M71_797160 [compost metagenome]